MEPADPNLADLDRFARGFPHEVADGTRHLPVRLA
jgi:hypothetical protein